jgi:LPLT family lysophospholipid transporter-like MFS transporter
MKWMGASKHSIGGLPGFWCSDGSDEVGSYAVMIARRNYPLLLVSQFLGAFGDNAILMVIIGQLTYLFREGILTEQALRTSNALCTSLLFVPYVLLAPLAGYLSDRYPKTLWLAGGNLLKLTGTSICMISIWYGYWWQALGYLVVGIGACVYSPAKYGILPEILPRERLVKANGTMELLTLVAILTGAIGGALLADRFNQQVWISFSVLLAVFSTSLGLNLLMQPTQASALVQLNRSVGEFVGNLRDLLDSPRLARVLIGTALFWFCGAGLKINFQPWGLEVLKLTDNTQIALLGLWLSVGVMVGSILSGQWYPVGDLRRTQRYGFGLATCLVLLFTVERFGFWHSPTVPLGKIQFIVPVNLLLLITGMIAGLFLIPLNAALQAESDPHKMGKTIAGQNFLENLAMVCAGVVCVAAPAVGITASGLFLVLAMLVAGVTAKLALSFVPGPPPPPSGQPTSDGPIPGIAPTASPDTPTSGEALSSSLARPGVLEPAQEPTQNKS